VGRGGGGPKGMAMGAASARERATAARARASAPAFSSVVFATAVRARPLAARDSPPSAGTRSARCPSRRRCAACPTRPRAWGTPRAAPLSGCGSCRRIGARRALLFWRRLVVIGVRVTQGQAGIDVSERSEGRAGASARARERNRNRFVVGLGLRTRPRATRHGQNNSPLPVLVTTDAARTTIVPRARARLASSVACAQRRRGGGALVVRSRGSCGSRESLVSWVARALELV